MEKKTTVLNDQSWLDIALQTCGSLESVFSLVVANNVSVIDEPEVGSTIESTDIVNNQVARYYDNKNIIPATNTVANGEKRKRGIGNMIVGVDFIVIK